MTGRQENTSSGLALPDNMTGSGGRQNTVLADEELLDTIGDTDLCNGLDDLGVPVTTIATDDEERVYGLVRP